MTGLIPIAIGLFALKKVMGGATTVYPHTMYNCMGQSIDVETPEQHQTYTDGGWVHDLSECEIGTPYGRDYGEYDYEDSVDDMTDTPYLWTNVWQTTDRSGQTIVIWNKQRLTYEPNYGRRGYYTEGVYQIGDEQKQGWNWDGDRIRTFTKLQTAIDYYTSISTVGTKPKKPEGDPMPEPEVGPVNPTPDDPTPTPQPVDPINPEPTQPTQPLDPIDPVAPINPPSYGFGDYVIGVSGF